MFFMTKISYIIKEGVHSSVRVCVFCHKFYIQHALPISPEIMDRFWCSRCLNDWHDLPDKIGSFVSNATTLFVVKIGINWLKYKIIDRFWAF